MSLSLSLGWSVGTPQRSWEEERPAGASIQLQKIVWVNLSLAYCLERARPTQDTTMNNKGPGCYQAANESRVVIDRQLHQPMRHALILDSNMTHGPCMWPTVWYIMACCLSPSRTQSPPSVSHILCLVLKICAHSLLSTGLYSTTSCVKQTLIRRKIK